VSRTSTIVCFIATVLAGLWLGQLLYLALPNSLTGWGIEVEYRSANDQRLQVYHSDDEEWFVEEKSEIRQWQGRPQAKTKRVFFDLPDAPLTKLRVDPASVPGEFAVEEIRIVGLCGLFEREIELRVDKAENVEAIGAGKHSYSATSEDPWFLVSYKKEPVKPPSRWFKIIHAAVLLAVTLLVCVLRYRHPRVGNHWLVGWRAITVLGILGFYLAYFVWPERLVTPGLFYFGLLPLMLGLTVFTLCEKPGQWIRFRSPAFVSLAALLAYFLIHAACIDPDTLPGRSPVVVALLGVLGMAIGCVVLWQKDPPISGRLLSGLVRGYITVTAVVGLYWIGDYFAPNWQLSWRMQQSGTFPLYRPISGSACFVLGLILLALLPAPGGRKKLNLLFVIPVATALTLWPLLCQSRGPMLAGGITLVVLFILHRQLSSGAVAAVFLTLAGLFTFTPAPKLAGETLRGVSAAAGAEVDEAKERRPRLLRVSDRSRKQIYRRYLAAIPEHLLIGHGFNPPGNLDVQLKHLADKYEAPVRTPHSVHLSVLYFGGLVGGLLHFATLGVTGLSLLGLAIRKRDSLALILLGLLSFATACITVEATLIAETKEAVLLWRPNSYWLYFWIPLCASVGYLASKRERTSR